MLEPHVSATGEAETSPLKYITECDKKKQLSDH